MSRSTGIHPARRIGFTALVAVVMSLAAPLGFPETAMASVADQRQEVQRIVDELDRLSEQSDRLAEDYSEAVNQLAELGVEIAAAEERIAAKQAELADLRGDLGEVALRSFTGSGADVLGPLFADANTYADGLRRDQFSRVALDSGAGTTDDLDELIADLDAEQRDLEYKRSQVEDLSETIAQKQQQTEDLKSEYTQRRSAAEARLGQLIAEEEQRRAAEAYARLQAELAAQQAAAQAPAAPAGGGGSSSSNASSGGGASNNASSNNASSGGASSGGGGSTAPAPPKPKVNIPSVSGLAGTAIEAARSQLGVPYRWATSSPGVGFDCSGLTSYAWGRAGVSIPRTSRAQAAALPRVPTASAQPGDLVFYYRPVSHVGIYIGGGQMIHAPNSGSVVSVTGVSWGKVTAVGRPG